MNQTIAELQEKGYRVGIKLLAVHPLLSLLGTHIRFEEMKAKEKAGRLVGKEAHDARYNLVAPTLYSVQSESLCNKLQIYGRTVEASKRSYNDGVHLLGTNPPNAVQLYQEEIDRRWTDNLVLYFDQRVQKVLDFMKMRNASESEIKAFMAEMRSEYPTQKQLQVLIEQQIEEQKATERLNRRLGGELPTINLTGTEFTIDWRLRELRENAAPWNKISFANPGMSESGTRYVCLYNTQKHTLYQVPNNIKSLPKNVVMLEIPYELQLDPVAVAMERNIDVSEFVKNHPIQTELKAVVKPLSETWVAELINENLMNDQATKKGRNSGEDLDQGYDRGPKIGR